MIPKAPSDKNLAQLHGDAPNILGEHIGMSPNDEMKFNASQASQSAKDPFYQHSSGNASKPSALQ